MKKIFINLLLAFPISLFGQTAEIKIDVDRKIAEIDPKIYGVFMEPIHFKGDRMCGCYYVLSEKNWCKPDRRYWFSKRLLFGRN